MSNLFKIKRYFCSGSGLDYYSIEPLFYLITVFLLLFNPSEAHSFSVPQLFSGEQTFAIRQGGEKVGELFIKIAKLRSGYRISSKSRARMVVLGFSRNAVSEEAYTVDDNLVMMNFDVKQIIDEKPVNSTGVLRDGYFQVSGLIGNKTLEKKLKFPEPVYPAPLINMVSMFICQKKKECEFSFFDPESLKIKKVSVSYIGEEKSGKERLIHYQNDLYPVVDNDVWLDLNGKTVRESVRHGLIETVSE